MKYWINKAQVEDQIIVITEEVFYSYSPREKELMEFQNSLRLGKIPEKISGMAFSRIRKINFPENKNKIEIHYDKKDILEVLIQSAAKKEEIKEALENVGPDYNFRGMVSDTIFEKSYKNIIGIFITIFLVYVTFEMAVDMENGWEYEANGLEVLLIGLAETTGKVGVLAIGAIILTLLIVNLYLKLQDKTPIETFEYH